MSNGIVFVVGLIAIVFIFTMIVAVYPGVMGSVANDATTNKVANNTDVQTGNSLAVGFMGFTTAEISFIIILLIVAVLLLIFVL
jgi:hypothetical protein